MIALVVGRAAGAVLTILAVTLLAPIAVAILLAVHCVAWAFVSKAENGDG